MKITDVFPALLQQHVRVARRQKTWTKRGPGRVHNPLTAREQAFKQKLTSQGVSASVALRHIGAIV